MKRLEEIAKRVEVATADLPENEHLNSINFGGRTSEWLLQRVSDAKKRQQAQVTLYSEDVPYLLSLIRSYQAEVEALRDYARWVDRVASERRMPREVHEAKAKADAIAKERSGL